MGKRANGEGSVFRVKKGPQKDKWKAVLSAGVDAKGKRIRRSRVADTQKAARAKLEELRAEVFGIPVDPGSMTMAKWLGIRLETYEGSKKAEGSVESRKRAINLHLIPYIGPLPLGSFSGTHAEALLRSWREAPLGLRSQEIAWQTLGSALRVAMARGHLRMDPLAGLECPKATRVEIDPFTDAELAKILTAAKAERYHALWILGFGTGMRIGEMLGLKWRDVDLSEKRIRVERSATIVAGKPTLKATKTKRSRRVIELPARVVTALHEHRKAMVADGNAGSELVFLNEHKRIVSRNVLRRRGWATLLKRAKVRYRTIHQMRHSFATHALSSGVPVHIVSAVLGHSQPSTTLNIYSHFLETHQSQATAASDRLLGSGGC